MPARRSVAKRTTTSAEGFSSEERAAMRESVLERKVVWGKDPAIDEKSVLDKIAKFPEPDRSMARRLHELVRSAAPGLTPRLWYGMPAYSKEGDVVCFFQPAHKFKARYGTLGFSDEAKLDEGTMWPVTYAVSEWTPTVESRIAALVKRAVG